MQRELSVFCDFDGTISRKDVTDALLEQFALPEWLEIEASWREGVIGSRECMQRQVALLRCSRKELDEFLDSMVIDARFPGFVAECRAQGIPVCVLSDGIDYAIHRVLRNHGLDDLPVFANQLHMHADGSLSLDSPHSDVECSPDCGTCKCALMHRLAKPGSSKVLVGDGASDFCAASEAADIVLAKDSLLAFCRKNALPHAAFADFGDATRLLTLLQQSEISSTAGPVLNAWPLQPIIA